MTLDYLSHIREETDRFMSAAHGNFARRVPSCPDWNVGELSYHVLEAFSFWRQIVEKRLSSYEDAVEPEPPSESDLLDALAAEATTLIRVLRETDPSTPIWTWSENKTAGFVPRRMAHEISVHRWDCENAAGDAAAVEQAMAWDGVREFFELFFLRVAGWEGAPVTVLVRSTDGHDEFEVRSPGSQGSPQATVEGTASDLLLVLWGRLPIEGLTVRGDEAALPRLLAASDRD